MSLDLDPSVEAESIDARTARRLAPRAASLADEAASRPGPAYRNPVARGGCSPFSANRPATGA